ncbi:MAG: hypothetical protein A2172_01225 [Candidatus Woykebacteria bacterium RBG_13_40_15]|uniref:Uncharacterized protein n=1 Tax=Candidatus Woykebacteria bacterium RBG_13_40_15 TaxID=1802593 RepID=A0A1G1W8Z8_9BACT|nr:MAG: hypothetical protein A2172_01225 [Candidatus Woykebacteria bacterium RBG_13_40_15]
MNIADGVLREIEGLSKKGGMAEMATRLPQKGMAPGATRGKPVTLEQVLDLLERLKGKKFGLREFQRLIESFDVLALIGSGELTRETLRLILTPNEGWAAGELQRMLSSYFPFWNEEIESSQGYPDGYRFKSAAGKLLALQSLHLLGTDDYGSHVKELATHYARNMPKGAEELLVCPKPSRAKEWGLTYSYNLPLSSALIILDRAIKPRFQNWWKDEQLGDTEMLRLTDKTAAALDKLEAETPGDYLVIPVQMGMRHRGRSARRAVACFAENEFGLGPLEVAYYLASCPERFVMWYDLGIICAGAECKDSPKGEFDGCPAFNEHQDRINLRYRRADEYSDLYGVATGFLS